MAKYSRSLLARAKKIKLLLMDVDGVMTDGKFYYVPRPGGGMLETKGFDSRDGLGLRLAHHAGLKTGIITGRSSAVIELRVKDLGIHFLQQNALEKIEPYHRICNAAQVEDNEVCYVGDDLTDCTKRAGGNGAVREAIELILTAQGKWDAILKSYLHGEANLNLSTPDESDQPYPLRPESPKRAVRGTGTAETSK
jgi:3-deoxy-D-manno-octulosonate 8-phosphate phosphatase (KDO 8-P phosphatase)